MTSSSIERIWLEGVKCSPIRIPCAIVLSVLRKIAFICKMALNLKPRFADGAVIGILAITFGLCYLTMTTLHSQFGIFSSDTKPHWTVSLLMNLIGYSAVVLPGLSVLYYVRQTHYLDNPNCMGPLIKLCFYGADSDIEDSLSAANKAAEKSDTAKFLHLIVCFFGLHFSYLTWGLLQEKIMTQQYVNSVGETGLFEDSQFLVFVNRVLAFGVALAYITTASRIPRHVAPIYKYSFCSISNIMSSWCQYEALKFVSFPTQVLAKASKIIPVMAMGRVVSGKTYQAYEYLVAVIISFGMVLFLYGSQETVQAKGGSGGQVTTISGFVLLMGYMVSDAFTSNWQNQLFTTYKMSPVQAMCGVNLFSCLFTSVSLFQQGGFYKSLVFVSQFPKFTFDCIILSLCSATGQLFIFHTISTFGPVAFVIIMTIRQAIAILLSCLMYNHVITGYGIFGVLVVFMATFFKIYCGRELRKMRQKKTSEMSNSIAVESVSKA